MAPDGNLVTTQTLDHMVYHNKKFDSLAIV